MIILNLCCRQMSKLFASTRTSAPAKPGNWDGRKFQSIQLRMTKQSNSRNRRINMNIKNSMQKFAAFFVLAASLSGQGMASGVIGGAPSQQIPEGPDKPVQPVIPPPTQPIAPPVTPSQPIVPSAPPVQPPVPAEPPTQVVPPPNHAQPPEGPDTQQPPETNNYTVFHN